MSMGYPLRMMEEIADLSIAEADQLARDKIEYHRSAMGEWRRARAERVARERQNRPVADIASDMGVHQQVIYDLLREAKKGAQ